MSFADLELLRQGVRLEPLLQAICDFLDKQPVLIERVRRDLRAMRQSPPEDSDMFGRRPNRWRAASLKNAREGKLYDARNREVVQRPKRLRLHPTGWRWQ